MVDDYQYHGDFEDEYDGLEVFEMDVILYRHLVLYLTFTWFPIFF